MSTIGEDSSYVHNYIEDKKDLENEGWNPIYIFETRFISENMTLYGNRMQNLEKRLDDPLNNQDKEKMRKFLKFACPKKKFNTPVRAVKIYYAASKNGFCEGDCYQIIDEYADDFRAEQENAATFIEFFRKIVADKTLIPDKSLILLSKDYHHAIEKNDHSNAKQSKKQASLQKASKIIKRTPLTPVVKNKEESDEGQGRTVVERILNKLRGEQVKLMWIPSHYELDPSQYVSIWLLNEISDEIQQASRDSHPSEIVFNTIQSFPHEIWTKALQLTGSFEEQYFEDDEDNNEEEEQ